ncbi:hypothetical protein CRUP_001686 [Coryphaenoides rupestris]|nr:hypothetical protein CRUP_001686 [Coryphaenoides rupestris]
MLLTYYMWIKAVKTGSVYWSSICALAYFYMLHACPDWRTGTRFSHRIYVAYCTVYCLGTILSMQISFVGFQVRLMLVLAPVMCILSGIGVSQVLTTYMKNLDVSRPDKKSKKQQDATYPIKNEVASGMILVMTFFLITYTFHSTWVTSEAYSSPSIVLSARGGDGSRIIFDDFREAYYWLRHNTPEDAKVMSWWDYGYQITAMANRTILVDNNTWNNTHISRVGQAMASTEERAYEIMRELDVSYVLVIFGGLTGYSSDGATETGKHIKEHDYYTATGEFRVDREGSPDAKVMSWWDYGYQITAMANRTILVDNNTWNNTHISRVGQAMASTEERAYEIMRELDVSYVLVIFGGLTGYSSDERPPGYDRVRNAEIGNKDFELDVLEEAYTTEHWLVKDLDNRGLSRT